VYEIVKSRKECADPAARPQRTRNMLQNIAISRATETMRLMIGEVAVKKCFLLHILKCNVIGRGKDGDDARCSLAPWIGPELV
jgi:hypothetical protein